jgi:hypothetical protein
MPSSNRPASLYAKTSHSRHQIRPKSGPFQLFSGSFHFFLDNAPKILQSNITKELHRRFGWLLARSYARVNRVNSQEKVRPMHDFLIALVFVAMVTSPAFVAAAPRAVKHDDL